MSLGSRLCSKSDILHRCILANVAFEKYNKVWLEKSRISLDTKVKLYEALVTPVLLYNCNSWAAPEKILQKVDVDVSAQTFEADHELHLSPNHQ